MLSCLKRSNVTNWGVFWRLELQLKRDLKELEPSLDCVLAELELSLRFPAPCVFLRLSDWLRVFQALRLVGSWAAVVCQHPRVSALLQA